MPATKRNLNLMLLPQHWDGHQLLANLLLLPNGDPTATVPVTGGSELAFANARPALRAALLPGLALPPWDSSLTPAMCARIPLQLAYSSTQHPLFAALAAEYKPNVPAPKPSASRVRKDLPHSYREATGFQSPASDLFTAVDGFGCALAAAEPDKQPIAGPFTIAWGEIVSYALRQPLIARAMGLMYLQVAIPLTPQQVADGGWIWLEIDDAHPSSWYARLLAQDKSAVATYAARLPPLTAAQDVFAALLFPTVAAQYDSTTLDTAQYEADLYLDGFAKIVHANQPSSVDAITNNPATVVPGTDAGIQIGWDDEQVTTWMNRQIAIARQLAAPATPPPPTALAELPFTVLGYRVDVRQTPADDWSSLCAASGTLNAAGVFTASFSAQELCVEPTPLQNGTQDFWLPQYFAQWRGRTLALDDRYAYAFSGGQPPAATGAPASSSFHGALVEALSAVSLRYGQSYQFRTRLADLTGGGPRPGDPAPADAGITTVDFRRYVPPKKLLLSLGAMDGSGNQTLTVDRPGINYPEMVFAGAANQATLDLLLQQTPPQPSLGKPADPDASPFQAALLDPDVTTLEIIVEAQAPVNDTGTPCSLASAGTPPQPGDLDGAFRVVYTWRIPFAPLATPVEIGASTPIHLTLQPTPMAHISHPVRPSAAAPTLLPIPTGRNIRIRLRGLGDPDPGNTYFASPAACTGLVADLRLRYNAASESDLFLAGNADQQLQAFYLRDLDQTGTQNIVLSGITDALSQPELLGTQALANIAATLGTTASTPLQRLAAALNLPVNAQTLSAPPGRRIVFGAQSTLRHTVPQDRSSITLSTQKDLLHHWIVILRLTLNRDWTWRGSAANGKDQITFTLKGSPHKEPVLPSQMVELSTMELPAIVSSLATRQGDEPDQRDSTELIFLCTLDTTPKLHAFPTPASASYQLCTNLTGVPGAVWPAPPAAPGAPATAGLTVPITEIPQQIPQLVSAGIAESPYLAAEDYSSTTQRQRALWFEFDRPPRDKADRYFVRLLNYGPDPLLISDASELPEANDTPIALDPEPLRKITPGSANDDAGLAAMTELQPSESSPRHFLVPLPEGIAPSSLDLFGFWTYELRCGHRQWSTAQGRFGRPLRVAGVQHPCPPLTATVERIAAGTSTAEPLAIAASADLAQTVLNGQSLTSGTAPQTQLWFLLYAQLRRADGKAHRNVLLAKRQGHRPPRDQSNASTAHGRIAQQRGYTVTAVFAQSEVARSSARFCCPSTHR